MLPEGFIKRLKTQHYIDAPSLLRSFQEPSPASIRINKAKWNEIPSDSQPVDWCSSGYYLEKRPSYTADPLFHAGCYYPQEASGMFLEVAFNQLMMDKTDLRILDLCGAPGGKSTHIASLAGDRGFLVANEVIRPRASILADNITRWGIHNTIVTNNDPGVFKKLEGYFDMIVVDAPCSGEGMFMDEIAVKEWSESNAAMCSERQRRIVMDVWTSLKKGGVMIYSTCTFNPGENEENVKWLADKTGASSISLDISRFDGIKEISYGGITGYGFYPGMIKGEGFFLSVLQKKHGGSDFKPGFRKRKTGTLLKDGLNKAEMLIGKFPERLFRQDDFVWLSALPVDEYRYLEKYLRIIKGGVRLFKMKGPVFIPAHDLALSVVLSDNTFPVCELDYNDSLAFLRRDPIRSQVMPEGWIIASYRGVRLGFMKNVRSRINNYYPVDWRIRKDFGSAGQMEIIRWDG